jgi:hypothetical protein
MMRAVEFHDFLRLYTDTVASPHLTVPEKVAIIEAAFDEYSIRAQPAHYMAAARRLATNPWRHHAARETAEENQPAPDAAKHGSAKGRVAPRTGR